MSVTKKALLIWYGMGVGVVLLLLTLGRNLFTSDVSVNWISGVFMMAVLVYGWVRLWRKLRDAHRRASAVGVSE